MNDRDKHFMGLALVQAQVAAAANEVPVGAIIVESRTDQVIASGANRSISTQDPTAHAEIIAIRQAAKITGNYRLQGMELYVTLEPCTMCAGAISHARIDRLVYGAPDLKGGAIENGVKFFQQASCHWRPEFLSGILADSCSQILKEFFQSRRSK